MYTTSVNQFRDNLKETLKNDSSAGLWSKPISQKYRII